MLIVRFLRLFRPVLSSLPLALWLLACGGGGDGGDGGTTPQSDPTVLLSPSSVTLQGIGAESIVTAIVAPSGATVAWTSSRPDVATVADGGTSGRIVAVAAGTTTITVQALSRGRSGSATVAVQVVPIVRSVRIDSVDATLVLGRTRQLRARVNADAGADTAVRWTSATPTVATVDASGLVTAVSVGTARIDVTTAASSMVTSSVQLTVVAPQVRSVAVSPGTDTIPVPSTRRFAATVDADGGLGTGVTWSSSDATVAIVAADGLVTAVAVGRTIIVARSVADTSKRAQATLVVRAPVVRGLTMTAVPVLRERDVHAAVVSVDAEPGADLRLAWTSSDNTVAVVAADGALTALRAGTTTLTVNSVAFPAVRHARTMTVVPHSPFLTWTRQAQGVVGTLRADGALMGMVSRSGTQAMMTLWSREWPVLGDTVTYAMEGTTWSRIAGAGTSTPAVIGLSNHASGEVIGWGGTPVRFDLYRWDGAWNALPNPPVGTFNAVPGPQSLPNGRIAAKGRDGGFDQILLWNGAAWSELRRWGRPANYNRGTLWMTTPSSGVLLQDVAGGHVIAEYTAPSTMRTIPNPPTNLLQFPVFRGTRPDSLFATGRGGEHRLRRWDGTNWSVLTAAWPSTEYIVTFEQCNGTLIVVTTMGRVFRWENGQFRQLGTDSEVLAGENDIYNQHLSCAPDGTIRVATTNGAMARWTGTAWTLESFTPRYSSVSAASATLAWAGSTVGRIYGWDGTTWQESYRPSPVINTGEITSIVSWPDGRVVALRGNGTVVRRNGGVWAEEAGGELIGVNAVWGPNADLVFAVRADGRIIRSVNGGAWQPVTPAGTALVAIDGLGANHAVAIGSSLRTLRWDGNTWTEVLADVPGVRNANRLHVSGVNDAWVTASANAGSTAAFLPRIRRFNGTTWTEADVGTIGGDEAASGISTLALFGTGASNVYALRGAGRGPRTLYRFDRTSWSVVTQLSAGYPDWVHLGSGVPGLAVIAGGRGELILSRPPIQ